jgi:hypothetical protein
MNTGVAAGLHEAKSGEFGTISGPFLQQPAAIAPQPPASSAIPAIAGA